MKVRSERETKVVWTSPWLDSSHSIKTIQKGGREERRSKHEEDAEMDSIVKISWWLACSSLWERKNRHESIYRYRGGWADRYREWQTQIRNLHRNKQTRITNDRTTDLNLFDDAIKNARHRDEHIGLDSSDVGHEQVTLSLPKTDCSAEKYLKRLRKSKNGKETKERKKDRQAKRRKNRRKSERRSENREENHHLAKTRSGAEKHLKRLRNGKKSKGKRIERINMTETKKSERRTERKKERRKNYERKESRRWRMMTFQVFIFLIIPFSILPCFSSLDKRCVTVNAKMWDYSFFPIFLSFPFFFLL